MDTSEAIKIVYASDGQKLEILVEPDLGKKLKVEGQEVETKRLLFVQEVFSDADKGDRASSEELEQAVGETQILAAAEKIAEKGTMQLTTEQKAEIREKKRRKLVERITRNAKNPRTGNPHPRKRVENALDETSLDIEADSNLDKKFDEAVDLLRPVMPISLENKKVALKIPAEESGPAYDKLQQTGAVENEKWGDGSLKVVLEMPAGALQQTIEEVQEACGGSAQVKEL